MSDRARNNLLKSAKTYLGIKGKRRSNPITTARFLGYTPRGRRGRVLTAGTADYNRAVDNEILRRYAVGNLVYSQTITLRTRRRYKNRDNEFIPHQVSFTAEGNRASVQQQIVEFKDDEMIEWDFESPFEYERNADGSVRYTEAVSNPVRQSGSLMVRTQSGRQRVAPIALNRLFMRRAGAYKLDNCFIENDEWDMKNNTCVFDWIYHKYKEGDCLKKLLKGSREEVYDKLNDVFNHSYHTKEYDYDDYDKEYDALKNGVSIDQLEDFCKDFRLALYAYDREYKNITRYIPDTNKKSKNPAMIFMIANEHFYPIEDIHHRKSLVSKTRNEKTENEFMEWVSDDVDKIFGEKNGTEKPTPIFAEGDIIGNEFLFKTITEQNILPSKLRVDGSQVKAFMIGEQKYITDVKDELDTAIENFCNSIGIQYWGQSVVSVLKTLLDEKFECENYNFPDITSKLNPNVYDALTTEGVKHRQHYGATDETLSTYNELMPTTYEEEEVERTIVKKYKNIFTGEMEEKVITKKVKIQKENPAETILDYKVRNKEINCYDINKAYTSVMYNPLDEFIVYDVDDKIEPYKEQDGKLKTGLYYVETYDNTLLHQSNWYSNKIIDLAREYNIDIVIKLQLIPKNNNKDRCCKNKEYLKEFMDWVMERVKDIEGGTLLYKRIFNTMYGRFGKTKEVNRTCNLDTNIQEVWRCFLKCDEPETEEDKKHYFYADKFKDSQYNRFRKDNRIICENISYEDDTPLYLFGFEKNENYMDIQLPIHLQILDWSNILLYKLQREVGGKCLFRKTDYVMMEGGKADMKQEGWGGYKPEGYGSVNTRSFMKTDRHIKMPDWNVRWEDNFEYRDSDEADKIIELANEKGGLLICGRAGTGKTFIIKNNKYMTDENTIKMSFTNKASRNCGGSTIHKTLKLNSDLKTQKKTLEKFRFKKYVIVDEIGMVNQDLLHRLQILKKFNPRCIFILCGGKEQLPPIEENRNEETDVFNHPIVLYLSHNNRIELTEMKRYDRPLWNYLERGYESGDWSGLPTQKIQPKDLINNRAICYYNKTRKRINRWAMEALKPEGAIYLKNDDEENDKADDVYLYSGLPIMSITNNKDYELINSDEYIVCEVENDTILIVEDGEEHKPLEIGKEEFHKLFVANYIATTHKSQGATYFNNIYLFDKLKMECDRRIIYTAVSRGTALNKIFIGKV